MEADEDGDPIKKYIHYPPISYRRHPAWFSRMDSEWELTQLLNEVYSSLASGNPRLSGMGVRAIIEYLMIYAVGDQGSFIKNINEFEAQGYISRVQKESVESVLEVGHAAIHRGYRPELDDLVVCLDICESIIETIIVNPQNLKRISKSVPPRKC